MSDINQEFESNSERDVVHISDGEHSDIEDPFDNQTIGDNNPIYNQEENEEDEDDEDDDDEDDEEEDDEDDEGEGDVSPSRQKKIMKFMEEQQPPLRPGDLWYLIDIGWYRRWKQYVKYDWNNGGMVSQPGPITNAGLLEPGTERVSRSLIEHTHYAIISEKEWEHLFSWYGGGPVIARPVIASSTYNKSVEIRKLELHFIKSSKPEETISHEFSKVDTVKHMKDVMLPILELEEDNIRIWDYHNKHRSQLLEDSKTLSDSTIIHNQFILFEEKDEDGKWPAEPARSYSYASSTSYSTSSYYSGWGSSNTYSYRETGKEPSDPGICGLSNLGNTCFMNSSLQSLSNSPLLTNYFLTNAYKNDINVNNVLGTGGKLVEQYANLLRNMWSGEYKYFVPREFKVKLESFAPQFQGGQQHDSQELLGYLLDGLHEDLNRVKDKPYIELKEANGRADHIVAAEAWQNHLARNDSIIVDWYQGQLKSKLTCPDCDRVSITFDPCMYLSLPLPVENTRSLKIITCCSRNPLDIPIEKYITVPKDGNISDIKEEVARPLTDITPENLAVIEIWHNKIYKVYTDNESIDRIQERDDVRVYFVESPEKRAHVEEDNEEEEEEDDDDEIRRATGFSGYGYYNHNHNHYRMKPSIPDLPDDIIHIQVVLRKKEQSVVVYSRNISETYNIFGSPLYISTRRGILYEDLHKLIARKLARFFPDPSVLEIPTKSNNTKTSEDKNETSEENTKDSNTKDNNTKDNNETSEDKNETSEDKNEINADNNEDSEDNNSDDMECSEEEEELEYPFYLQILDSMCRNEKRRIEPGENINFRNSEILGIAFTAELYSHYNQDEENNMLKDDSGKPDESKDDSIDISDCLELFSAEEQLGPDDPWYCNKCKEHKQATKKFDLWKLPPLLCIQLKRFSYKNRYRRDKLDTLINFPLTNLDLSKFVLSTDGPPPIYDLMAVSNHFGALGGGHYTAFAKNYNNNQWYKFDDSNVSQINEERVCSTAAYVLFYRRRDVEIPCEKLKYDPETEVEDDEEDDEDDNDNEDDDIDVGENEEENEDNQANQTENEEDNEETDDIENCEENEEDNEETDEDEINN